MNFFDEYIRKSKDWTKGLPEWDWDVSNLPNNFIDYNVTRLGDVMAIALHKLAERDDIDVVDVRATVRMGPFSITATARPKQQPLKSNPTNDPSEDFNVH